MRKIEILAVVSIVVLGTLFTFSFGNLIAMDHTAGILGIHFLVFLVLFGMILIFSKPGKTRRRIRIILGLYLLTLVSYSITILTLRSRTDKVFEYLYSANAGEFSLAEKLLNWYCASGMILTGIIIFLSNRAEKTKQ